MSFESILTFASIFFLILLIATLLLMYVRSMRVSALNQSACMKIKDQKWDEALGILNRTLKLDHNDCLTNYNIGFILYFGKKDIDKAEVHLKKALKEDHNNAGVLYVLGHLLYHSKRQVDLATRYLHKAITSNPLIAEPYNTLGLIEIANENWIGAISNFKKAVEINPKYASAWCNISIAYLYNGNAIEAIRACKSHVSLCPHSFTARCNMGNIYGACGRLENALDEFKVAINIDCNNWKPYFWAGCVYLQLRHYQKAIDIFKQSLERQNDYPLIHYNLALAYEGCCNERLADYHIERAIELNPDLGKDLMVRGK